MHALLSDLRYAARTLLRTPGFTLVVVATLALGIGANTAIYSVVDAVLLESLPYDEPDRLVAMWADVSARGGPEHEWLNYEDLASLAEEANLLESAGSWSTWSPTLAGRGDPEVVEAATVSHEVLTDVLRETAALGRFFTEDDDVPGAGGVVVLSYASWQQRFGGDPELLGSTLMLSDFPYEVVGVAAAGFRVPVAPQAELFRANGVLGEPGCRRGCFGVQAIARLAPGVSIDVARARARDLGARIERAYPDTNTGLTFTVVGLREELTAGSARPLWVLLGAVALVLLIACANVASLLLVRGAAREGEMSVRAALGAGRGTIVRHLVVESLLLAGVGGLAGLALATWGTGALLSLAPSALPRTEGIDLDGRVLAFTVGVTVFTGLLFGLFPSWRASRPYLHTSIRAQSAGPRRRGLGNGLVVGEVGLALVLLVGAGLLLRSFHQLTVTDLGYDDPRSLLAFRVAVPPNRYDADERYEFFATLVGRVAGIPGVRAAGAVNALPLDGTNNDTDFLLEGEPPPVPGVNQALWLRATVPGYLETMGIELVEGRSIVPSDDAGATLVAVVNESFAGRYFGGDVIGRRIQFGNPETAGWWTIVGVARDTRHFAVRAGVAAGQDPTATPDAPAAYLPYAQARRQFAPSQMSVVARVQGDPLALVPAVRSTLQDMDPALAASRIQPMQALVSDALARDRFVTVLLSLFAATAVLLAALGLYGVVAYGVNRRMREMGIRTALGAERSDLGSMVVGGGLKLAAGGIGIGVVGAWIATRVLGSLLYGVGATDPLTFGATALLLVGVALFASWLPTRRLARVDPVSVLKSE